MIAFKLRLAWATGSLLFGAAVAAVFSVDRPAPRPAATVVDGGTAATVTTATGTVRTAAHLGDAGNARIWYTEGGDGPDSRWSVRVVLRTTPDGREVSGEVSEVGVGVLTFGPAACRADGRYPATLATPAGRTAATLAVVLPPGRCE